MSSEETLNVEWKENLINPQNWSYGRKWTAIASLCCVGFSSSFSSSIFAPAVIPASSEFGVSQIEATLGVSLFVLGFVAGLLLLGPLSEAIGRKRPFTVALVLNILFQLPIPLAPDITVILIFRFLSGVTGSAAFTIPPGIAVDVLSPAHRGVAMDLFMTFTLAGPILGPVAGSYLVFRNGWRWTGWVAFIAAAICNVFAIVAVPESHHKILLERRVNQVTSSTGNAAVKSRHIQKYRDIANLLGRCLKKPVVLLLTEPILFMITLYSSVAYGILFLIFFAYPYCFQSQRTWRAYYAYLPFLGLLVGALLGCLSSAIIERTWWLRRYHRRRMRVHPEDRLAPMLASAVLLPVGLLWFAWTSNPATHWAAQVSAGVPIGAGIVLNVISSTSYLCDIYLDNANSAVAALMCMRSVSAAAFPLFALAMYKKLGTEWATSLLAFLCFAMAPCPFLLWKYGTTIRGWSKYSRRSCLVVFDASETAGDEEEVSLLVTRKDQIEAVSHQVEEVVGQIEKIVDLISKLVAQTNDGYSGTLLLLELPLLHDFEASFGL